MLLIDMRIIISIIVLVVFVSCNNNPVTDTIQSYPENSKTVTVKLADSLGNVSITLPSRYDTSYIWTHYSDCGKPCEKIKYRFQPKSLSVEMESGFFYDRRKDSLDRFTIIHSGYFPFNENRDSSFIFLVHERLKEQLLMDPATNKVKWDTVEKIADRYFSIISVDLYDSLQNQYSKKLLGYATIKGNGISFHFELLTKQKDTTTDSFINNSLFYLRSIRLSKEQ
jgi:hypothetical protein